MWRWRTKHMMSLIGQTSPSTVQSVKTHVKLPFSKAHSPTILINISLFRCWTMYNPKLIMKSRGLISVFKIYSTQKDRTNLSRLVVRWCVSPTNCRISSFSHWFWGVATLPIQFSGGGGAPRGRSPAPLVGARRVAGDLPEACGEAPGGESGAGWLGDDLCDAFCSWVWFSIVLVLVLITNRTAQGGGGNFKDRTL